MARMSLLFPKGPFDFGDRMRALPDDGTVPGASDWRWLATPGHSPGHVAFVGHGVAFGGDCLFAGSVGRTDLPLSDPRQLATSLGRLTALPPQTVVYPGHGPATTIGAELESNPYLNGSLRLVRG